MSNTNSPQEEIIKLWNELKIESVHFEFSCGGDSMNDTSIVINGLDGSTIENDEIASYFDNEVYNRVEFYVNSDGHYQGENGTVYITLEEGEDDFSYSKSSQSEWSENYDSEVEIELSEEEAEFLKSKVLNINGAEGEQPTVNYKGDCILSDIEEELVENLQEKILNELRDFQPEIEDGELQDWFTFTTSEDGGLTIVDNKLKVEISNQVTVYRDE